MDDRAHPLPAQPRPREELPRLPQHDRHPAALAAAGARAHHLRSRRGRREAGHQGGHADRHRAGGRRRHHHLRDAEGAGRRRRAARSLLQLLQRDLRRQLALFARREARRVRGVRRRRSHRPLRLPRRPAPQGRLRLVGAQAHHQRARSRRPRPGAPARVGILERPALARAAHHAGRGRARRGRLLRAAGPVVDPGARHRGLLGARAPRRGAAESVGDRDRHRKAIIETAGEGVVPDIAFANLDGGVFLALDLGKNIFPDRPTAEDRSVPLPRLARDAVAARGRGAHRDRAVGRDRGAAAGAFRRSDPVVGVLRRQEVARARQVGAQGHHPLAGESVGLRRRNQRLLQDRRRHLPRAVATCTRARSTARTTTGCARASSSATSACPAATCSTETSGCGATTARSSRRRSSRSASSIAPTCST